MKFLFGLGIIIATFGVILIYDARPITKKMFSFGDQNEGSTGLKILGFLGIRLKNNRLFDYNNRNDFGIL